MPGAGPEPALRLAGAILKRLRDAPLRLDGGELHVSVTIGVATVAAGSGGDLFEAADRALYAGKRDGWVRARKPERPSAATTPPCIAPPAGAT